MNELARKALNALSEKDIEGYIWNHPDCIDLGSGCLNVHMWIARQFRVPSGIIDLLGVNIAGDFLVIEVKKGAIDARALAQVGRYAADIKAVLGKSNLDVGEILYGRPRVRPVCIGFDISDQTMFEANALGINVVRLDMEVAFDGSRIVWKDSFSAALENKYEALTKQGPLSEYIARITHGARTSEEFRILYNFNSIIESGKSGFGLHEHLRPYKKL